MHDRVFTSIGLLFIGIICAATPVYGQNAMEPVNPFVITKYTTGNGLPINTATDLLYARDGYLYAGTASGLLRLDGIHLDTYNVENTPGLKSNRISQIFDLGPNARIITDYLYRPYLFTNGVAHAVTDPATGRQLQNTIVQAFNEESALILDNNQGFLLREDTLITLPHPVSEMNAWDGYMTPDSTLYLLNTEGFYTVSDSTVEKLPIPEEYLPDLSAFSQIEFIDGHIRLIGSGNIACWNNNKKAFCPTHSHRMPSETDVRNIKKTGPNAFLIATSNGFFRHTNNVLRNSDPSREALYYESVFTMWDAEVLVSKNKVTANGAIVYESNSGIYDAANDGQGGLWLTTAKEGLIHIRKNMFSNYNAAGIENSYAIVEDSTGSKYIGSFTNGFMRWANGETTLYNAKNSVLKTDVVRMIHPLRDNSILVAEWGQAPYLFTENNARQITELEDIFKNGTNVLEGFQEYTDGRWWLGTKNGLYIWDEKSLSRFTDSNGRGITNVNKIVRSPYTGALFFSTSNAGVVMLENNTFHFLSASLPESAKHIRDIYQASADTVWAVSYNSGIHRYVLSGDTVSVDILGPEQGIKSVGLHRIIENDGTFWISSNKGLLNVSASGLSQSADQGSIVTNLNWFYRGDGLFEEEFNGGSQNTGLVDRDGKLWFTNIQGVTSFDPRDLIAPPEESLDIRLQELMTENRTEMLYGNSPLTLGENERSAKIRLAHMALSNNRTDHMWYRIPKITNNWTAVGNDGWISLKNIPRGELQLEITANPDRSVNRKVFFLNAEPWWFEIAIFRYGLIVLLLSIGVMIFVYSKGKNKADHAGNSIEADTFPDSQHDAAEPTNQEELPNAIDIETNDLYWGQDWLQELDRLNLSEKYYQSILNEPITEDPIKKAILQNFRDPDFSVAKLSSILNTSRSTLYRKWGNENEISIVEYITRLRILHAVHLLLNKDFSISDTAHLSGFNSPSYFTKVFKKELGNSPRTFLNNHR